MDEAVLSDVIKQHTRVSLQKQKNKTELNQIKSQVKEQEELQIHEKAYSEAQKITLDLYKKRTPNYPLL